MGPWRGKSPHQQPGELQRCTDCKARLETERVHQNSPQGYVGAPREDRLQAKQSWGLPYPSARVLTLSRAHTVSPTIKVAEGKIGTNISGGEDRQLGECKSTPLIIPVPPRESHPRLALAQVCFEESLGLERRKGITSRTLLGRFANVGCPPGPLCQVQARQELAQRVLGPLGGEGQCNHTVRLTGACRGTDRLS